MASVNKVLHELPTITANEDPFLFGYLLKNTKELSSL